MSDLRFASLGSGSKGNASLICAGQTTLMVDCGFSIKEACRRFEQLAIDPESISALLVTHEHGDHSRGVARLARRYEIPVWSSRGTAKFLQEQMEYNTINVHQPFIIGDITIQPVAVPHDAREPCQFIFSHQENRFGLLTDVGEITPYIAESYQHCHALLLEFNHDLDMLWNGEYSMSLKKRVAGRLGHLNNGQSTDLLKSLLPGNLRFVMAAHLSESNNTEQLVESELLQVMDGNDCQFGIASQHQASEWISVGQIC
jgi:phosphoribosyl 1,2-cyclic phosphodiesterase